MDRLVIESILADVDEVHLSNDREKPVSNPSVILGFKAANTDQVIHAFKELKKIALNNHVEFVICKTHVSGIYDLEIKTDALDEPIRILNKVISNEVIGRIENQLQKNEKIILGANVSEEENWIEVTTAQIRECSVKQQN